MVKLLIFKILDGPGNKAVSTKLNLNKKEKTRNGNESRRCKDKLSQRSKETL